MIELISPFPPQHYPLLWKWLHEFPASNFDDFGPHTLEQFAAEMDRRAQDEQTWCVTLHGEPVGAIGYCRESGYHGHFNGICFARDAHGTGVAREAIRRVMESVWATGTQKVSAYFFAHNRRVLRFLLRLGAVREGVLKDHTLQDGKPIDVLAVAFFAPEVQIPEPVAECAEVAA
jgi:RimJ/RimL family protein N-acetyltransferase